MIKTWHREVGLALVMSLLPGVTAAQDVASSLEELLRSGSLRPGDGVYVTDIQGYRLKGALSDLSSAGVKVTHRSDTRTVLAGDLWRIERQDSWENGFGLGLLVGAASFYGRCEAASVSYCLGYLTRLRYSGPYLLVGAVVGIVVDAHMHKEICRAGGSGRRVVEPLVSQGRYGAQVTFGW